MCGWGQIFFITPDAVLRFKKKKSLTSFISISPAEMYNKVHNLSPGKHFERDHYSTELCTAAGFVLSLSLMSSHDIYKSLYTHTHEGMGTMLTCVL